GDYDGRVQVADNHQISVPLKNAVVDALALAEAGLPAREIKERLEDFFAKRDIAGAKAYMLACLEKRPDVLMEASDITGELKMSMQVIAVCELEKQAYGSSTIDRIQDFGALMAHFQKLNDMIQAWKEGENEISPSEVEFYLKNENITGIALEASARLFYPAAEAFEIAESVRTCGS
ncbi:MAG: hypothetical protein K2N39_01270, partial [Lachnospiraceae bacterium]|nr:hypothetical protein [Lachnospiraceae bacterium]